MTCISSAQVTPFPCQAVAPLVEHNPCQASPGLDVFQQTPERLSLFPASCLVNFLPLALTAPGEQKVAMTLSSDIHMSPSSILVRLLESHTSTTLSLYRYKDGTTHKLSSFFELIFLNLKKGERVAWSAQGEKARELIGEIQTLNENNWVRPASHTPSVTKVITHHRPAGNLTAEIEKAMAYFNQNCLAAVTSLDGTTLILGPRDERHFDLAQYGKITGALHTRLLVQKDAHGIFFIYMPGSIYEPVDQKMLLEWLNTHTSNVRWYDPEIARSR